MSAETPSWESCTVTRKMHPSEDLITFQGQRVSAEGKAILLERLKTGEDREADLTPTALRRFCCLFLDGIIVGIAYLIVGFSTWFLSAKSAPANAAGNPADPLTFKLLLTAFSIAPMIYFAQMHAMGGRTIGKMAGKLRVVNLDGSPIEYSTAYLRAIYYFIPSLIYVALIFIEPENQTIYQMFMVFNLVWFVVCIAVPLTDRRFQRAIHDRMAGTRVIVTDL